MKKKFIFFILIFISLELFATNFCFRQFTIDDGIPQSSINQIVQDSTGFIWLSTNQGLYRFDGSIFKKFNKIGNNNISVVNSFTQLNNQNYAISDMWNLYIVSLDNKFSLLYKYKINHQIRDITCINGNHYFTTETSLLTIDENLKVEIVELKIHKILSMTSFQNKLYLSTEKGLFTYHNSKLRKISSQNNIITMYNDNNKILYLGTDSSKILLLVNDKIVAKQLVLSNKSICINTINKDKDNNLWIGTTKGVYKIVNSKKTYYSTLNGLGSNIISKIFVDTENNIWFGLYGKGLSKYTTEKFINLQSENGLDFDNVTSISQDKSGNIYLTNSMENRINIINRKNYNISNIKANIKSHIVFNKIYSDRQDNIWLINFKGKIFRLIDDSIVPFHPEFFRKNYHLITDIIEDYSGNYWISTESDLVLFDGKSFHKISLPKTINKYSLYKLFVDSQNQLWIGTTKNGLFLKNEKSFQNFTAKNGLPSNYIIDITQDNNSVIWIATNRGFSKYNHGYFTNFDTKSGLSNNICTFIKALDNKIFIGTVNGLNVFNGNFIKCYYKSDGIVSSELNRNAAFIDKSGNLWFGSKGGVTKYDPTKDFENIIPPKLYIMKILNLNNEIPISKKVTLKSTQNNITIYFSAISFTNPENLVFEYKLEPSSADWIQTKNNRIDFNNLSPNKYSFQLRAKNSDDIWSHKPKQITFVIKQPLLLQNKFIALYFTLFLILVFYIFYRKNHLQSKEIQRKQVELTKERSLSLKLKIANEKLTQFSKMKDDFLSKVSHELRTPLNAIIGLSDYLLENLNINIKFKKDLKMISQSAKRLNSLVTGILDFTKLQNKEIIPNPIPLDIYQQIEMILTMFKSINTNDNIQLINEIPSQIALVHVDETHFYHIITNIVSNAIKFTHSGFVKIQAFEKDDFIQIDVQDTGIGIPKDKFHQIFYLFEQIQTDKTSKGTGLGLSITKKFIELNKGKIWLSSELKKGSTFHILLPKSKMKRTSNNIANLTKLSSLDFNSDFQFDFKEISHNSQKSIILAIDDEISNLQVLEHYFSESNLIFRFTDSAEDGLDWILSNKIKPDLILLDIMMPRISGFDILSKIREKFPITNLPVILLTAKNQLSDFVNGFELGANDYIVKPYTKIEVLQRVKMHLNISRIHRSMMRFVPHEFLNYINKDSFCDIELGDNKKSDMAIMFSDIRSFTEMSEAMTPKESFFFLNSFLKEIGPIIRKHKGFIDNFIGDATLSVFPGKVTDAVLCAIHIQKHMYFFNNKRKEKQLKPIAIGIGIHWAELIIGTIGEKYRMAGTVISSGVNLSSRLENLTKFYKAKILVSATVINKLDKSLDIKYRFLGNISLQGISNKVLIYEILDCYLEEDFHKRVMTKVDFEKGVSAFEKNDFDTAANYFNKIVENNKSDLTAKTYFEQCLFYQNKKYFK
jgi:signal transduction histidine kinase/ligand-binding sensor domain-containing protein/class 3 adenylate cyclase/ActR/RegA family two-component response regulator